MRIFISHSSKDSWVAKTIEKELSAIGADTFLDAKSIQTGQLIDQEIQKNLKNSDELLILISSNSVKSHWVWIEVGSAIALGKKIIPIYLNIPIDKAPQLLSLHLGRDINNIDSYYKEVRNRLAS